MSRKRLEKIKKSRVPYAEENSGYYWRSCKRKARFEEFEAKGRAREYGLRAYECSICGLWHLTSKGESY